MSYDKKQIMVIDPATRTAELDCYNTIASSSTIPTSYHLPAIYGMDSILAIPQHLIAGIIMFGSGCSVYDNLSWHTDLNHWFKDIMEQEIPVLGCCYGHQLIAYLYKSKIDFATKEEYKFKGTRKVSIVEDQRLKIKASTLNLIVSHNEVITTLPEGFEIWGSSDITPFDGIRHTKLPIWSLQAHPEATAGFMKNQEINHNNAKQPYKDGHFVVNKFIKYVTSFL